MSRLAIFALGPLRIELDGLPLQTSRHKALALLVYLAMYPAKQSRQVLSALFWPDYEQEKAFAYLRRTLWEIHSMLGESWLDVDRTEIGFSPQATVFLDVAEFQSHLAAFHRHSHPGSVPCQECLVHLHTAALLYRGDFLSNFSLRDSANFEDWQFFQGEALRREYADALQSLVKALQQEGSLEPAMDFTRRWLALDPLNEEAQRQLMYLYALTGQRNAALRQYQECKRLLLSELGVTPDQATTTLFDQIQSGQLEQPERAGGVLEPATQVSFPENWLVQFLSEPYAPPSPRNLPAQPTPFIGRREELDKIAGLLHDPACWLLTLLGPGGVGKTRLAIQAGLEQQATFPHGVFFVSLSSLYSEQSIVPVVAGVLGLAFRQDGPSPEQQLFDYLREKRMLVVLDTFEHLVKGAGLLQQIHAQAEGVRLLVTSRQKLQLQGEWVLEVQGLDYPDKLPAALEELRPYSAVQLFLQAARRSQVDFEISQNDLLPLTRITQLLEGMPLGLELAATWVKTLSCEEIAFEITHNLDFLETSLQDLPERQRSLRAVFDHSWNLLNERERRVFPRLSVFQGGFTRQAAGQIAGVSLRDLSGLVDKSFLRSTSHCQAGNPHRFEMHDLLHQYAAEKLENLPVDYQETHDRHCSYFSAGLKALQAELRSPRQGRVLREMEADWDDSLAAWDWASRHQLAEYLEQALEPLCMYALLRVRYEEGIDLCQKAEASLRPLATPEAKRLRAQMLTWQAMFSLNLGRLEECSQSLESSQSLLEDPDLDPSHILRELAFLRMAQAFLSYLRFDPETEADLIEESYRLYCEAGVKSPRMLVFIWKYLMGGNFTRRVWNFLEQKLSEVRAAGDDFETALLLFTLGIVAAYHGNQVDQAETMLKESNLLFQGLGDPVSQVMGLRCLNYLLNCQGQFEQLLGLQEHLLVVYKDLGDRVMIGTTHAEMGETLTHLGRYAEAEEQMRDGLGYFQGISPYEDALRHRYLGDILLARGRPSEALAAYQYSLAFFQAVDYKGWVCTALTGLSRAELALGDSSNAWAHVCQALRIFREMHLYAFFLPLTFSVLALLLADRGDANKAAELYGIASRQPYLSNSRWFADLYTQPLEAKTGGILGEEVVGAQMHRPVRDLWEIADSLWADLGL